MYRRLQLKIEVDAEDNIAIRGAFGDPLRSSLETHSFQCFLIRQHP